MSDLPSKSSPEHLLNGNTTTERTNGKGVAYVEPPRREDLQPSYAKMLQPDTQDKDDHGWYGSMISGLGSFVGNLGAIPCCICCPNRKLALCFVNIVPPC